MAEENEQDLGETGNGNSPEANSSDTGDEPEKDEEPITAERAFELAKGLQKGYTLTRQEMSEIKNNLEAVKEAVESIKSQSSKDDDFQDFGDSDVLTKKDLIEILDKREREKAEADAKLQSQIDAQITDLRLRGIISSEEDEEALMDFAVKHKIADLDQAASIWQEVRKAEEVLRQGKKGEEGSAVGNSEKASGGEQGEAVKYSEVHSKDWDEI